MKKAICGLLIIATIFSFSACNDIQVTIGEANTPTQSEDPAQTTNPDQTTEPLYTVTFNTNGGTPVNSQQTSYVSGMPQTKKEGYTFNGWFLDSSLTEEAIFPLAVNNNITLYAKWTLKTYVVTYITNGGNRIDSEDKAVLTSTPTPSKNGYMFDGWYLDATQTEAVTFPMTLTKNITLFAKWVKIQSKVTAKNQCIKMWSDDKSAKTINITPNDFDMDRFAKDGYTMTITVTYDVRYEKSYDVPLDIGYMGSPKYEISIQNKNSDGTFKEDLTTSTKSTTRTITYTDTVAKLKNDKIILTFSTNNIQNTIYFENITVTYQINVLT